MTDTLELSHWINGERVGGDRPAESINPSDTREVVARTPDGTASDVDDAVAAAKAAFPSWSEASPEVRSDVLDKASNLLMERRESVGRLLSR
ncbi:MAG: aldehyde dehydrogenase family protein, partial [Brevundimonas sp.]